MIKLFEDKTRKWYFIIAMLFTILMSALAFFEPKSIYESKEFLLPIVPSMVVAIGCGLALRPDFSRYNVVNCLLLPLLISSIGGCLYSFILGVTQIVSDDKFDLNPGLWDMLTGILLVGSISITWGGILFFLNIFIVAIIPNFYIVSFLVWKFGPEQGIRAKFLPLFLGLSLFAVCARVFVKYQNQDPVGLTLFTSAIFIPLCIMAIIGITESVSRWKKDTSIYHICEAAVFFLTVVASVACMVQVHIKAGADERVPSYEQQFQALQDKQRLDETNRVQARNIEIAKKAGITIAPRSSIADKPNLHPIYRSYNPVSTSWFYTHNPDFQPEGFRYEDVVFQLSTVPVINSNLIYQCGNEPVFYLGTDVCSAKVMPLGYASRVKTDVFSLYVWTCQLEGRQILSTNYDDCKHDSSIYPLGFVAPAPGQDRLPTPRLSSN